MVQLTLEAKESIVAKALTRGDTSLRHIASDCGVSYSTLQSWLSLKRQGLSLKRNKRSRSSKEGFQTQPLEHLLATSSLDEEAIGAYCREQGIHRFQLTQWRDYLMKNDLDKKKSDSSRNEIQALRKENKLLKKDLRRKDKALAETSALLILKKKADLIWGGLEDD